MVATALAGSPSMPTATHGRLVLEITGAACVAAATGQTQTLRATF